MRSSLAAALVGGFVFIFGGHSAAQSSWQQRAPMPITDVGHAAAALNGIVHVVGEGDQYGCGYYTTHLAYDPVTDIWSRRAPMLVASGGGSAAVLNDGAKDLLYVVGGVTGCGTRTAAMEAYDPDTNTWTMKAPMPHGPRSEMGAAVINNLLYVVGGAQNDYTGGITNLVEVYDPVNDVWLPDPPPAPHASYGMAVGVINGILYIAGGDWPSYRSLDAYDPVTRTWSTKMPMPVPRIYVASGVVNNRLYVIGGEYNYFLASVDVYDPATNSWSPGPSLPAPRAEAAAAQINDRIYLTGGWDGAYRTNTNFMLQTVPVAPTPPSASLSAAPNPAACNQAVLFDGSGSTPGSRPIIRYEWNFGDGATLFSGGPMQGHAYSRFGTYSAALTVYDDSQPQLSASVTVPITINQGNRPPLANPGSPYAISGNGIVRLNGTGSFDPDASCGDSLASYSWTIDGNVTLSGPSPAIDTAAFALAGGVHDVTLQVTDSFGASASASTTLTIRPVLVSVSVVPSSVTLLPGQHQLFQAIGSFSDNTTRELPPGRAQNGPGPTLQSWWVHFFSSLPVGVCSAFSPSGSISSQSLRNNRGTVQETWNGVSVSGTMTDTSVNLTLRCKDPASTVAPGAIAASWTGTRYEGSFQFGGANGNLQITGWSRQTPMPVRRASFAAAAVNGIVYTMGGVDGSTLLDSVDAYSPSSKAWTSGLPPLPTAREGLGAAAFAGRIYAIGGRVAGGVPSGVVEVFDPAANAWTTLPPSEWMPTPRAHLAVVTDGAFIYAVGGDTQASNAEAVATLERYDPVAHAWLAMAPMPAEGNVVAAGVLNHTIVVIGAGGISSARVDLYDIPTNTWRSGVSMPFPRASAAVAVANGGVWVVGGAINGAPSFDTWVYYPQAGTQTERWTGSGGIITPREGLAAAAAGDVVYALGGLADDGTGSLAHNEAFSVVPFGDWNPGGSIGGSSTPPSQWSSSAPSVVAIGANAEAVALRDGTARIVASAAGLRCRNGLGECAAVRVVLPNRDPVCRDATPSVATLWPVNHQFMPISIDGVADPDGDRLSIGIDSIYQDEPVNDVGDGSTGRDGDGLGGAIAYLRAERAGKGNGRVYHVSFTATDGRGGACSGEAIVRVPRDASRGSASAVDDGPSYNSVTGLRRQ